MEFRDGVEYNTLKTEYVEKGGSATAPEVPTFAHYEFTGWDVQFDNVTNHTVVTAQYDYKVDRDESFVYLTLTQGSEAVIGKSGTPLILYPIAYTEGMTVEAAFTMLQQQEYPAILSLRLRPAAAGTSPSTGAKRMSATSLPT